jgi:hypothetical protein
LKETQKEKEKEKENLSIANLSSSEGTHWLLK